MDIKKKLIYAEDLIDAIRDDPNIDGKHFARVKRIVESLTRTSAGAETCVSCGAVIPEGRQVCPNCERSGKWQKTR